MENKKIYLERIKSFINNIEGSYYKESKGLEAEFFYCKQSSLAVDKVKHVKFKKIKAGDVWGNLWDSAWFRFKGKLDKNNGKPAVLIDIQGEGAIFKNDSPYQGITHKHNSFVNHRKRIYFIEDNDVVNGEVELLLEGAANEIIGSWGVEEFRFIQADLCYVDVELWGFYHDLLYFYNLLEAQENNSVLFEKILYSLNEIVNIYRGKKDLKLALSIIDKLKITKNPIALNAVSIGHGHLDIAWLWSKKETRRKAGRTFSTAIRYINQYPGYIFGASQPLLYQWVKEDYPQLYSSIKEEVQKGSWECQGAMWVEPDTNLPSGESLIRQCYWGMKFYKDEFNVDINNLWLPDVFGYCGSLPGILRGCGVTTFLTTKLAWSETNKFPYDSFKWIGIDGQTVLTHLPPGKEYHTENLPKQLVYAQKEYKQKAIYNEFINLFGIGDGGGGPSRRHIEMGNRSKNQNGVPSVVYKKSFDFFKGLIEVEDKLPEWKGELYLEFHRGTYTSASDIKKLNRKLELALRNLEIIQVLYSKNKNDLNNEIEELWKVLLENQFHDILPGSSINVVNKEAVNDLSKALNRVNFLINNFLKNSFNITNEKESNLLLINTLGFERNEYLLINKEPHSQIVHVSVPSMGYKIIDLDKIDNKRGTVNGNILILENSLVKYSLDPHSGSISQILLKGSGEIIDYANRLLLWRDEPSRWDAWDISSYYRETSSEEAVLVDRSLELLTSNMIIITQTLKIGSSTIIQELRLDEGSTLLRVKNQVDWNEERKLLRVESMTKIRSLEANFEIPYGNIKRSTSTNNSWEKAQFEVPGQRYANISDCNKGLTIISDSKYGYSAKNGSLDLSLLRSPKNPDTELDKGVHTFTYCYYPHCKTFEESNSINVAHSVNNPLIMKYILNDEGDFSFFTVDKKNITIEVIKQSFSGEGIVLRLYETLGISTKIELKSEIDYDDAFICDHVENIISKIEYANNNIPLSFEPFEIKTLLIK